jgi:hypothetical protein
MASLFKSPDFGFSEMNRLISAMNNALTLNYSQMFSCRPEWMRYFVLLPNCEFNVATFSLRGYDCDDGHHLCRV